ncbi:UNVERIFIED_CONTAM: Retrovirus-related Pol polyprotein from transposon RE1 [Sesamum indicum]
MCYVALLSILQEPRSYTEVVQHQELRDAMRCELDALEKNNTWSLSPLPEAKWAIGCKWVYKTKLRADGTVERYKARLVVKGFTQVKGVDYTDSFSLVAKTVIVRLFLAATAVRGWPLQQLDINNAFLHGHLDEDIYMTPPEGYTVAITWSVSWRSLYGLKQASHQWNVELTFCLTAYDFNQSAHDHYLFVKHTPTGPMALLVYVNDILLTSHSLSGIQEVKDYLYDLFTIKNIGNARNFLGLEITRNMNGQYVSQTKYVINVICDIGLTQAKSASTPLPQGLKLRSKTDKLLLNPDSY